jgi:hypothetical protein
MQSKIRPRVRSAEMPRQQKIAVHSAQHITQSSAGEESGPPLPVLARLPDVSLPPERSRLSLGMDWLKRIDWQQVRRIKLDPNWVAGGVLSLVLLLLLVITFNRSDKTAVEPTTDTNAPAWSTAGKSTQSPAAPTGVAAPLDASASAPQSFLADSAAPAATGGNTAAAPAPESQLLYGVYYPRTPYDAVVASPFVANGPGVQPYYGNEIRTAQRDPAVPVPPSTEFGSSPSNQARFEGGIIPRP